MSELEMDRQLVEEAMQDVSNQDYAYMMLESVTQVFPDNFEEFTEERHADGLMMFCFAFTEMAPHPKTWDREAILERLRTEVEVPEDSVEMVTGLNGAFKEMGLPDNAGILALFYQEFVESYYGAKAESHDTQVIVEMFAAALGGE